MVLRKAHQTLGAQGKGGWFPALKNNSPRGKDQRLGHFTTVCFWLFSEQWFRNSTREEVPLLRGINTCRFCVLSLFPSKQEIIKRGIQSEAKKLSELGIE